MVVYARLGTITESESRLVWIRLEEREGVHGDTTTESRYVCSMYGDGVRGEGNLYTRTQDTCEYAVLVSKSLNSLHLVSLYLSAVPYWRHLGMPRQSTTTTPVDLGSSSASISLSLGA